MLKKGLRREVESFFSSPCHRAIFRIFACFFLAIPLFAQESRGLDVVAKQLGGDYAVIGKQIAVFIAIDKYNEWMPLKNPVKDSKEIASILKERYWLDEVKELYDEDASRAGIIRIFQELMNTTAPEDSIFIYYAGHGKLDNITDTGSWIPVDAGTDEIDQRNWIANSQIRNMIGKMKARHVVLVSDSCFSGDILNPSRSSMPVINDEYFRNAYSRISRQVLTSGSSETVPDNSPFSHQLKLAFSGNTKPYFDPLMLFNEIRLGVKGTTPLFGNLKDSGHQDGGSFLFFLRDSVDGGLVKQNQNQNLASMQSNTFAELFVRTQGDIPGADVYMDGVVMGKAPLLLQKIAAGKPLTIEVKTESESGKMIVVLNSKELKEISVPLERMKGNLLIQSSSSEVRLFLDNVEIGPIGSGLFRDIPSGEHKAELIGDNLYWESKVKVPGFETAKVNASVQAVGCLMLEIPDDVTVTVNLGDKAVATKLGPGAIERLSVGIYEVRSFGSDYTQQKSTLRIERGTTAKWIPYTTGQIVFAVEPNDATWTGLGIAKVAWGQVRSTIRDVPPGTYSINLKASGYRDTLQTLKIEPGRTTKVAARLQRMTPGSIVLRGVPFGITVQDGQRRLALSPQGDTIIDGIPAGIPISYQLLMGVDEGLSARKGTLDFTLEESERRVLILPSGRFSVPWMPDDASFSIIKSGNAEGKLEIPMQKDSLDSFSPPLAPGTYSLSIDGPYKSTFALVIKTGETVEPENYRSALSTLLEVERAKAQESLKAKKTRTTLGWVSLGTGAAGAIVSAIAYYSASSARSVYDNATTTAGAISARSTLQLWGGVFTGAAIVGTVGLGLPPFFSFNGPSQAVLEKALSTLDSELKMLSR